MDKVDIIRTISELIMVIIVVYSTHKEEKLIRFEEKVFIALATHIRKNLKKNKRFMAWLNKPPATERIGEDLPTVRAAVKHGWRNQYGLSHKN